jgi:hypothetical protein
LGITATLTGVSMVPDRDGRDPPQLLQKQLGSPTGRKRLPVLGGLGLALPAVGPLCGKQHTQAPLEASASHGASGRAKIAPHPVPQLCLVGTS